MSSASEALAAVSAMDSFTHVRIINSMGISFALSRLLIFASKFIQHPKKQKISFIHTGWIFIVFLWIVTFWWDYLLQSSGKQYDVSIYLLDLFYVFGLFFVCVTLTPDDISEYGSYEQYFYSRKIWLFSLFIILDVIDTLRDLHEEIIYGFTDSFIIECVLLVISTGLICIAMKIESRRFQIAAMMIILCLAFYALIFAAIFCSIARRSSSEMPIRSAIRHIMVSSTSWACPSA